jgi:hypothetical protein
MAIEIALGWLQLLIAKKFISFKTVSAFHAGQSWFLVKHSSTTLRLGQAEA